MKKTVRFENSDVQKVVVFTGHPDGDALISVYDGTGGSDEDQLITLKMTKSEKEALIKALQES
jgi:hypothetical protein